MSELIKEGDQKAQDYADAMKQIEMQKVRIGQLETQLRQAIDIAQRASDKEKARKEAEKEKLITSIAGDSKYDKGTLTTKTLEELQTIRTAIDNTIEKTFASVAAEIDESRRPRKPHLTVGEWDSATKTWRGGV